MRVPDALLRGPGGRRLVEILKQGQYQPLRIGLQVASVYAGVRGFLDNLNVDAVRPFEAALHRWLLDDRAALIEKLEKAPKFDQALDDEMKAALAEFKDGYVRDNANVVAA